MMIDTQSLEQIRRLSKDEDAFHQLVSLYEQNQARSVSPYFSSDGNQGVAAYHAHLIEIVGDAVISLNSDFTIVSWNKAAETMYGWREDEVIGRQLNDVVPTEYPGGNIQDTLIQLEEHGVFQDDFIHQRRDGTKFYIHTVTSLIRGEDNQITGYVAINRDISARRETERKLAESEQLLRAIYEGTQTAIFVIQVTEEGDFRYGEINPAYEQATGLTAEFVLNKTPDELPIQTPETAAQFRANYQRCLDSRKPITCEEEIHSEGRTSWWLTQLTPLITPDQQIHTIVGTTLNITELRKTQEILQEREQFLKTIYDSEQLYVFVADVLENDDFRYVAFSPGPTQLRPDQLIGKRLEETGWPLEFVTEIRAHYMRCVREGVSITFEHADGEKWWLTQLTPLHDAGGRVYRLIGISLEITERKRMEQASERLSRLEMELEKERELRSFQTRVMTMITHDFKTPLATIQTSTDLLKNYAERFTGEAILKRLDRIQAQVRILDDLVDETIALRRSEIYDYEPHPERIDISKFITTLIDDVHSYAEQASPVNADFRGEKEGMFDATLLRQIAMNLIMNAVKYSPAHNTVRVQCNCQPHSLTFIVEDSGIGIPEEEHEHIFKLFYRAGNAVNLSGNGMGLAIVKQAVDWHGGSITMTSRVNQGTRFEVTLPQLREVNP